jgi:hypothetical protein
MPLRLLTPPYLLFFALLNIALGHALSLKALTVAGAAGVALAVGLLIRNGLRRRWIRRLDGYALAVQARMTAMETLPWFPGARRPYRLTVEGLTAPATGRIFRSDWISPVSGTGFAPERLAVLIDPKHPSRYFVDIRPLCVDPTPWPRRLFRALRLFGLVFLVFYVEDILVSFIAYTPEEPRPPGPVRGEAHASGRDFGKGVGWSVDACQASSGPERTVSLFQDRSDPYPEASIVGGPSRGVAAFEIRRSADADAIRFYPADCTRIHGDVQSIIDANGRSSLEGYADAECVHGPDQLSIHVDFEGCRHQAGPHDGGDGQSR